MIKLDDNLLAELGLQSLPPEEKKNLLRHIYETLEMRVGTTLSQQMTDAQLDEFESFINANDEAGALRWLETNFPNYKDVVAQEFEKLKQEVRQSAPQILANVAAMGQQQPAPQYQQPYQQPMQQPMAPGYAPQPMQPAYQQPQPSYYPQPAPAPQPMQQPMAPQPAPQQPVYAQPAPAMDPAAQQQQPAPAATNPTAAPASTAPQYPTPVPVPPMPTPAPGVQPTAPTNQDQYGQAA